jgi:choline kinase
MRAFLYAAGRATRLGREFAHQPKILIEIGGRSLLEWHAIRLAEAGVRHLSVITGYERGQIAAVLPGLERAHGIRIEEIPNPDFSEGSVLSVHVSLPAIMARPEPALLMDGDVFYPAEMIHRLLRSPNRTTLLVDRNYSTADDDPVLVPIRGGRPFEFRKRWQGEAEAMGESIGFFKVDAADLPALAGQTELRAVGKRRLESYDEIIRAMVQQDLFGCEDVTGLPWTEVDFPQDVAYAREEILPAIAGRRVEK